MATTLAPLLNFLPCATPTQWVQHAINQLPELLIDHANCEKKAAASALSLIHHYPQYPDLLQKMSRLAREELRHFEQVLKLLNNRNIQYRALTPSRYASGLKRWVRKPEPQRLLDTLIIGALIEARSCERFASLIPVLDSELATFYQSLLNSEARHFQDYLYLAQQVATQSEIDERCHFFCNKEKILITSADNELRFHSGMPVNQTTLLADTYTQI